MTNSTVDRPVSSHFTSLQDTPSAEQTSSASKAKTLHKADGVQAGESEKNLRAFTASRDSLKTELEELIGLDLIAPGAAAKEGAEYSQSLKARLRLELISLPSQTKALHHADLLERMDAQKLRALLRAQVETESGPLVQLVDALRLVRDSGPPVHAELSNLFLSSHLGVCEDGNGVTFEQLASFSLEDMRRAEALEGFFDLAGADMKRLALGVRSIQYAVAAENNRYGKLAEAASKADTSVADGLHDPALLYVGLKNVAILELLTPASLMQLLRGQANGENTTLQTLLTTVHYAHDSDHETCKSLATAILNSELGVDENGNAITFQNVASLDPETLADKPELLKSSADALRKMSRKVRHLQEIVYTAVLTVNANDKHSENLQYLKDVLATQETITSEQLKGGVGKLEPFSTFGHNHAEKLKEQFAAAGNRTPFELRQAVDYLRQISRSGTPDEQIISSTMLGTKVGGITLASFANVVVDQLSDKETFFEDAARALAQLAEPADQLQKLIKREDPDAGTPLKLMGL